MCARQLQRICNTLFVNLFVSFIVLVVISQQTHCAEINNANTTESANLCNPNRCGPNADCVIHKDVAVCRCADGFSGDPYTGCTRACETSKDCYEGSACVRYKCVDPCAGACGIDAVCIIVAHNPICTCRPGYTGDPFSICTHAYYATQTPPTEHACQPSPCGPYSACSTYREQAVCSCLPKTKGSPPNCIRLCASNSECDKQEVCQNQRCVNPCSEIRDFCAPHASCYVRDHNVHCSCPRDHTGDPFSQCSPGSPGLPGSPLPPTTNFTSKCQPSPCGPNSQCREIDDRAICTCIPGYAGSPPSCRPPCTINADCGRDFACINLRCRDPCPGTCGTNAVCRVVNHIPICLCADGYTGNPFETCFPTLTTTSPTTNSPSGACLSSPCGLNAVCADTNGTAVCTCLPGFVGSPLLECRPECYSNLDCPIRLACINHLCKDPCPGVCGINAKCQVEGHSPICSCFDGDTGNPFVTCSPIITTTSPTANSTFKCQPSPCGPNSECREINDTAVCSCIPGYAGSPPSCLPPCTINADCGKDFACIDLRCRDPCTGTCGTDANCQVLNHSPICSCPVGQTGNPFEKCYPIITTTSPTANSTSVCTHPNPCGYNSQCREIDDIAVCACIPGFVGTPPSCRPQCIVNADCYRDLACINQRCRDPCPGTCGTNAICKVVEHSPTCRCPDGHTGDPFLKCSPIETTPSPTTKPPSGACQSSPCGLNTVCTDTNGTAVCTCLPGFMGSPLSGCRPECIANSDCINHLACINQRCKDPCPYACGEFAICNVPDHIPQCSCPPQHTGDPYSKCSPI